MDKKDQVNGSHRISDAMLDAMLAGTVFHSGELLSELRQRLAEQILDAEMEVHLDQDVEGERGNTRNGHHRKTVLDGQWLHAAGGAARSTRDLRAAVGGAVLSSPSRLRCPSDPALCSRPVDPAHSTHGTGVVRGVGVAGVDRESDDGRLPNDGKSLMRTNFKHGLGAVADNIGSLLLQQASAGSHGRRDRPVPATAPPGPAL